MLYIHRKSKSLMKTKRCLKRKYREICIKDLRIKKRIQKLNYRLRMIEKIYTNLQNLLDDYTNNNIPELL